ncbi:hypothetical protein [Streptomyces sp. MP131-18]|uniref:hypothetical protein n=1 Tax=Streptomyces sp. MP131-18 TaxID=1857892 RepID=UPI00097C2EDD|nr:hypothetical protein [Streptomyces sp. MP131-18]ONK09481.1 hypothetical protein STBA_01810 [Streptomyces sp. MP131-18]
MTEPTPAETLTAAAERLETAATSAHRASPEPWTVTDEHVIRCADDMIVADRSGTDDPAERADLPYIATMHPGVGRAIAAWLHRAAGRTAEVQRHLGDEFQDGALDQDAHDALAVARAILAPAVPLHGPQDATTATHAGTETPDARSRPQEGAQAIECRECGDTGACAGGPCAIAPTPAAGLRDRIETALDDFDAARATDAVLAAIGPELTAIAEAAAAAVEDQRARADRAEAQLRAVRAELDALDSEAPYLSPVARTAHTQATDRIRAELDATNTPKEP